MNLAVRDKYWEKHKDSKDKYWGKCGIYGIYCNNQLVYIGKSKNLFQRFCAHQMNTFQPTQRDYNTKKYTELRQAVLSGAKISFKVIQYTQEKDLNQKEYGYINLYYPRLNKVTGRGYKQVESIKDLYAS